MNAIKSLFTCTQWQSLSISGLREQVKDVIVFINPKSGGQKGAVVCEKLKKYINPERIYDLTQGGPKNGLETHKNVPNLRIIACGGDGTVGWVLSVLDEMQLQNNPSVAIIPLGTGNDLARTLNWGGGYSNERIENFLNKLINGKPIQLDRWNIKADILPYEIDESKRIFKQKPKNKLPLSVINNYFSIGADAKVALDFHSAREKDPTKFKSQTLNKIKYIETFGRDLFFQSCRDLISKIEVFQCDDTDFLPKIKEYNYHSILFLNIPSYASGRNPWKNEPEEQQSFSDGKLEIVGFHTKDLMFLQVGGHGDKIGQASKVFIKTSQSIPMQIDGEPVLLEPAEIHIDLKTKSWMVRAGDSSSEFD